MIKSKEDYKTYYKSDCLATGLNDLSFFSKLVDRRPKFYKSLRLTEYYLNCRRDLVGKVIGKFLVHRHYHLCNKYNWTIPTNVFGPGLAIVHAGTIVVSGHAKVGANCRIHVCSNIGYAPAKGKDGAPILGDNIYIGPGAKIFGPIEIGDNVAIGANAVVNSSFKEGNCTIAGIPAKKISDNTSEKYINKYII